CHLNLKNEAHPSVSQFDPPLKSKAVCLTNLFVKSATMGQITDDSDRSRTLRVRAPNIAQHISKNAACKWVIEEYRGDIRRYGISGSIDGENLYVAGAQLFATSLDVFASPPGEVGGKLNADHSFER